MAGAALELEVGRNVRRSLDEARATIARIADRIARADLEGEARYAGTLLAALSAAERTLCAAADPSSFSAAADAYVEKLSRAAEAVSIVRERALSAAGGDTER